MYPRNRKVIAELIFQSTSCQSQKKKSDRNIRSAIVECLVPNKEMILLQDLEQTSLSLFSSKMVANSRWFVNVPAEVMIKPENQRRIVSVDPGVRTFMRMRWKIRDLIEELHHKTALFLVKNFDVIIIPKFETSQMSERKTRKIRSKTCSWNGVIKNIGGAKLIRDGNIVMDRDYNGARGDISACLARFSFSC